MKNRLYRILAVCAMALAAFLMLYPGTQNALAECNHHWVEVHADSPTCTKDGASYQECSICFAQRTVTKPATGHTWEQVGYTAPSCKPGAYYYECADCSAEKTEAIPANGNHDWKQVRVEKPTCTKEGTSYLECTLCSAQKTEHVPTTNHTWEQVGYTAPSCKPGAYYYECANCSAEKTEAIPANGDHDWKERQYTAPTCVGSGAQYLECSVCGEQKTGTVEALGHDWKEVQYTAPTCVTSGSRYIECSRCREQKTETVPATGEHSYTEISRINATCDTDGKVVKRCSVCGKEEAEILKSEEAHNWEEVSLTSATCSNKGSRELRCSKCGRTQTETITATGKHEYGEWVVVKETTDGNIGRRERVCSVCGKVKSEIIRPGVENGKTGNTVQLLDNDVVNVYTSGVSVNLRRGPSKDTIREAQIDKKDTNLGELQGAEVDNNGTVWYQILYKNKTCYVTSEFSYAVCGTPTGNRIVTGNAAELDNVFLKSVASVLEKLNLNGEATDEYEYLASADGLTLYGNTVVEKVELSGSGYTFFGVKVGDDVSSARTMLKDSGLRLGGTYDDLLVFEHVCSPDSLAITKLGFDSVMVVEVDDGKVISMTWEAYTIE